MNLTHAALPSLAAAALLAAPAAALAGPSYLADLGPLNGSGVTGTASVVVNDDGTLTVTIAATGLTPGEVHPQHIHGFDDASANSVVPPASAAGDDGVLSVADGLPFYGPVRLPLATTGGPLFPVATDAGTVDYARTFTDAEAAAISAGPGGVGGLGEMLASGIGSVSDLFPLDNREVVLHGLVLDGAYSMTTPAAAGDLVLVDDGTGGAAVVPLPAGAWAGLGTLGLVGGANLARRRRATA